MYAVLVAFALLGLTHADFYEADVADPKTGTKTDFLLDDSHALPSGGFSLNMSLGVVNVTSFTAGGTGKKCEGEQLDMEISVSINEGVPQFSPRVKIEKMNDAGQWETMRMGLLGITMSLDFTLPQLAGPDAPSVFEGGQEYSFGLRFKNALVDTPIGKTPVCVNINTREIVAKAFSFKWIYYDVKKDMGDVFYMNLYMGDEPWTSIRLCLKGEGQC